ncbi:MAG: nucleotide exchange factor GrpE [Bacillota bacterium]
MSGKDKKKNQEEMHEEQKKQEATEQVDESEEGKEDFTQVQVEDEEKDEVLETGPAEIVDEEPEHASEEVAADESEQENWQQEKEELLDRIKRKQAEMDNLRRISKKEQTEAREYALYDFLVRLLPVLDNLERGLETARADEEVPDSYVDGLEMIYKQLYQVLEQEGVCVVEAEGAPFDPHCHHAVMEVESEDEQPGNVVEVLQKGYWHRDRILRPAMVKVCRE